MLTPCYDVNPFGFQHRHIMIKPYEKTFLRTLVNICKNLDNGLRCKHAAMLIDGNKIISIGVNKAKSSPIQKEFSRSKSPNPFEEYSWIHAEVDCVKNVKINFKKTSLFVIRTDSKGQLRESCPCEGCKKLINKLEIPRIIYSTAAGKIEENIIK